MPVKESNKTPVQRFRESFNKIGLPEKKSPTIGKNLASLSSENLADLMTRYTAWREYTEDILVEATVEFTNAEQKYDDLYDKYSLVVTGSNRDIRHAKIMQEPEVKALAVIKRDTEMYHKLLLGKLESFNNCLTIISREISRRSGGPMR